MMLDENLSIAQVKAMGLVDPNAKRFLSNLLCSTYEDFVALVYENLEEAALYMEEDAAIRIKDGEDRLTSDLILFFRARGFTATHDEKINGHSDVVIKKRNFMWLGEAKIHSDYDYLFQGFNQLCTRYSTGNSSSKNGGLIIYVRNKDVKNVIDTWKIRLSEKNLEDYDTSECEERKELSFYSVHKHSKSGLIYKVKHLAIILNFEPMDK